MADTLNESENVGESGRVSQDVGDLSQGYCVDLYVYGDGSYAVGEPEPIDEDHDDTSVEKVPDLATALKHLIHVVKSNPVGASDEEHFAAGFSGGASPAQPVPPPGSVSGEPSGANRY
jgi:hypothetical protein